VADKRKGCFVIRLMRRLSCICLAIVLGGLVSAGDVREPQTPDSPATEQTTKADSSLSVNSQGADTVSEHPFDDGPYVFWQTDSSAIVFYLCKGAVEHRIIAVVDTLRFNGFCHDSIAEYVIPVAPPAVEPDAFNDVPRIMALSDIHGEYEHLLDILKGSGVIDDGGHWSWGRGHLVIVGDVFDRGDAVTECLWLIHRLEREARRSGGCVHFTLGNHEIMVLTGDNRYINEKYLKGIARKSRIKHEDLYGPDMELGRWLRSRHTAVRINDIIFVHAGIAPCLIDRYPRLPGLNEAVYKSIDLPSTEAAFDETLRLLYGSKGPFWYRGYHYEMEGRYPMASPADIDSILNHYGASAVVVGHTEVDSIVALFDNRIMAIDVRVEELGALQALLWEDGRFYRVAVTGERRLID